jgi:hypothetical protein
MLKPYFVIMTTPSLTFCFYRQYKPSTSIFLVKSLSSFSCLYRNTKVSRTSFIFVKSQTNITGLLNIISRDAVFPEYISNPSTHKRKSFMVYFCNSFNDSMYNIHKCQYIFTPIYQKINIECIKQFL